MSGTEHDVSSERGKVKAAFEIKPGWLDMGERTARIHASPPIAGRKAHKVEIKAANGRHMWVFQFEQFTKISYTNGQKF